MKIEVTNKKSGETVSYDGNRLSGSRRAVAHASALASAGAMITGSDPERMGRIKADLDGDRETLIATLSHAVSPNAPFANWVSISIDGKDVDSVPVQATLRRIASESTSQKSEVFVYVRDNPTWSLFQTKGILGPSIGEGNTITDRLAAASGVIRVGNGFRCPDNTENGGTFTDINGSTCGVRLVMSAVEGMAQDVAREIADIANGAEINTGRQAGRTEAIRQKNRDILERVAAAGGDPFRPSKAYVDRETARGSNGGWALESHEDTVKTQQRLVSESIDEMRVVINGGDPVPSPDLTGIPDYLHEGMLKTVNERRRRQQEMVAAMSPELRELIRTSTNEELLAIMRQRSLDFSAEVSPNIRVAIPSGKRLDSVLTSGRYLTTHEAVSDHSTSNSRLVYERQIGMPEEVAAADRPASGYVVHPSWEQRTKNNTAEVVQRVHGRDATEFDYYNSQPFGNVSSYGDVEIILRPEVSERSAFGQGDSLRTHLRPMSFRETDPDTAFLAIVSANGADSNHLNSNIIGLLESSVSGSFERLNLDGDNNNRELEINAGTRYMEALVMGSFGLEDVAEIRIRENKMAEPFNVPYEKQTEYAQEQAKLLTEEFFSQANLKSLGFTEEEIEYIMGMIDAYSPQFDRQQYLPKQLMISQLVELIEFRNMNQRKQILDSAGVRTVALSSRGNDPFDPASYKGMMPGESIEDLLKRKTQESLLKKIRADRAEAQLRAQRAAEREALGLEDES